MANLFCLFTENRSSWLIPHWATAASGCAGALKTRLSISRMALPHTTNPLPSCLPLGRVEAGLTAKLGLAGEAQWISNSRAVYQSSCEQLKADLYQHVDELLETCRVLCFWWALARWAQLDYIIPAEFYTFTPSLHYSLFLSKKIYNLYLGPFEISSIWDELSKKLRLRAENTDIERGERERVLGSFDYGCGAQAPWKQK